LAFDGGEWSASCSSCFTTRVRAPNPLDRRLGGPQIQPEHDGKEKNIPSLPLLGNEPQLSSL